MSITVRVGKLPGRIDEFALEDGANKVSDALSAAGLDAAGFDIRVNSTSRDVNAVLRQGDTVLLVKQIKGNMPGDHITVRVGKLPGRIDEYGLNGNRTVAAALEAAGLSAEGFDVRVNSTSRGLEYNLAQGDTVLLVKQIKGNNGDHITVRVGKLPGRIDEFGLNGHRTVADALSAAGLDSTGFDVRVNSTSRALDYTLSQGDTVLLVKQIKGNLA